MRKLHLAFVSLGFLAALPVMATTLTTTSYQTWASSSYTTGTPTLVDLDSLNSGMQYGTSAGLVDTGYTFTGPDGSGFSLEAETLGSKTGLVGAADGTGDITVNLPNTGSNALFFYANTANGGTLMNGPITLTLSDGESFNINSGMYGLSISHLITSFTISTAAGQSAFLQYVYFGNSSLTQDAGTGGTGGSGDPAPTPEAATLALVGGGALVLFGARRKFTQRLAV